jgi:hypothetical protein
MGCADWIGLAQNRDRRRALVNAVMKTQLVAFRIFIYVVNCILFTMLIIRVV